MTLSFLFKYASVTLINITYLLTYLVYLLTTGCDKTIPWCHAPHCLNTTWNYLTARRRTETNCTVHLCPKVEDDASCPCRQTERLRRRFSLLVHSQLATVSSSWTLNKHTVYRLSVQTNKSSLYRIRLFAINQSINQSIKEALFCVIKKTLKSTVVPYVHIQSIIKFVKQNFPPNVQYVIYARNNYILKSSQFSLVIHNKRKK